MSIPSLIEIAPLPARVNADISVPGSKSITNRALILAALAEGQTILKGALWSEDTQVMVQALKVLGFEIQVEQDPEETCNRTIRVQGLGGKIPAGSKNEPAEIFVGNAGTAARFLAAMVCLGNGVYRLEGVARMHQRPQGALFAALRQLGYRIDPEKGNDNLPVLIYGAGPREGKCQVSIRESSQFASALLLCAQTGGWQVEVEGDNAEESAYVALTIKLVNAFPPRGGEFQIEPDASSASYFFGADWLLRSRRSDSGAWSTQMEGGRVQIGHWPQTGWQIDAEFPRLIFSDPGFPKTISRETDLGDSIMTGIVISPFAGRSIKFTDLGRLRVQECERVMALRTELTKCGGRVIEEDDTLTVFPGALHGATIETYDDHRMAMCFAILGLKIGGIKLQNPGCVKKTFPNFFQKLAAAPPRGLGVTIRDGLSGRELCEDELFAG